MSPDAHGEEFGLFNNKDESTIEYKFWMWMGIAKSAEMHADCFAAWEFEAISVSPVWKHVERALKMALNDVYVFRTVNY